jgi:hypothetical protein
MIVIQGDQKIFIRSNLLFQRNIIKSINILLQTDLIFDEHCNSDELLD